MNWMKSGSVLFLLFLVAFLIASCVKEPDPNPEPGKFDRGVLLANYADQLVIPAFTKLNSEVSVLNQKLEAFVNQPTLENLQTAQNAWVNAYLAFQHTNSYNFGPAGESGTRKTFTEEIGTFPVNESKLNSILNTGTYNINDFNRDTRGFLAIEFLLFDLEDNNSTVLKRFENPTAGTYLKELGKHLKSRTEQVENDWKSGYRMAFIQNNGTDAGSAVSMLYNDFVKSYEGLKNFKVGLPLGKRPGQTAIEPNLAEAYYSGKSITFLKEHFRSMEDIWHGKSQAGVDGPGFKEYLESVEGGKALVDLTLPQLEKIKSDLNSLPPNPRFSQQLTTNFQQIDQLHTDLQKHTRFFKSDMSSVLGIAITYSSGDGD